MGMGFKKALCFLNWAKRVFCFGIYDCFCYLQLSPQGRGSCYIDWELEGMHMKNENGNGIYELTILFCIY